MLRLSNMFQESLFFCLPFHEFSPSLKDQGELPSPMLWSADFSKALLEIWSPNLKSVAAGGKEPICFYITTSCSAMHT